MSCMNLDDHARSEPRAHPEHAGAPARGTTLDHVRAGNYGLKLNDQERQPQPPARPILHAARSQRRATLDQIRLLVIGLGALLFLILSIVNELWW
jgi:hypothetical protein